MRHDRIVVGVSLGGVDALQRLLTQLPADFPAAIFVVQHTLAQGPGLLASILDRACAMTVITAQDGLPISNGHVYVAPPDRQLLVDEQEVHLVRGPKENCSCPAIDPLFRSAAAYFGSRTVGVILTGRLGDGSSGLLAVRRCGGKTLVQEAADAFSAEMPTNALHAAEPVDYQLPVADMGAVLQQLASRPVGAQVPVPKEIQLEVRMAERIQATIEGEEAIGELVPIACPECGGPLWQKDEDRLQRFRCHVGHAFTALSLMARQSEDVEKSLWMTLRVLEERANLLSRMAGHAISRGHVSSASLYTANMPEIRRAADDIRQLLSTEA